MCKISLQAILLAQRKLSGPVLKRLESCSQNHQYCCGHSGSWIGGCNACWGAWMLHAQAWFWTNRYALRSVPFLPEAQMLSCYSCRLVHYKMLCHKHLQLVNTSECVWHACDIPVTCYNCLSLPLSSQVTTSDHMSMFISAVFCSSPRITRITFANMARFNDRTLLMTAHCTSVSA